MEDRSLSAISHSTCSDYHILTEVEGMYGRNKLTEENISKLRDKIEIQKRKVSDSLTSSYISSQDEEPVLFTSNRKVAKLTHAPLPHHTAFPLPETKPLEYPSRKIAPNDPNLSDETRPKRIIGKTDPTLLVSNLKTKTAVRKPVYEKPKQKCAKSAGSDVKPSYITPFSWRKGQSITSLLLRYKSRSEGSLSSSATMSDIQVPDYTEDTMVDTRFRRIMRDNGLFDQERESLHSNLAPDPRPSSIASNLPLDPYPTSPEHSSSLSTSVPNLQQQGAPETGKKIPKENRARSVPSEEAPISKVRHYERKTIQNYIRKQKEDRKDKIMLANEEKMRARDEKNQRLQELYTKQKCKLHTNLMHSKARQFNIPSSYFSQPQVHDITTDIFDQEVETGFAEDSLSCPSISPEPGPWINENPDEYPIAQFSNSPIRESANKSATPTSSTTQQTKSRDDLTLSFPPEDSLDISPPIPPSRSTRVEKIRIAALSLREKLAEGYQRAGRELANVHLPGTPSCDDVITHSNVYTAVEDNIGLQHTEFSYLEATNENYNRWRDNTEFITAESHILPDSLAPVFLVKTRHEEQPNSRQSEIFSLSQTDWGQRADGDPMSAVNIYARKHQHATVAGSHSKVRPVASAVGVQTYSPEKDNQAVDTVSLNSGSKRGSRGRTSDSNLTSAPSVMKRQAKYKHRKKRLVGGVREEEPRRDGDLLVEQMKQQLEQQTLEEAAKLIKVETLASQLPSSKILSEYQDKIKSQSNFYEQQIKLIANRMELETYKPVEFRQLSPLTETTEPEFGEKADVEEELPATQLSPNSPETKSKQIEEAREKNRSSAEHLSQEINRAREEATRAVIEKAKHQIESDQKIITSTPSATSLLHPSHPPPLLPLTSSQLETPLISSMPRTYSEDFNSESVLSVREISGSHTNLLIEEDIKLESDTEQLDTLSLSPVEQMLPIETGITEDSMISISDMSLAYTSEAEQLQNEDKIFQMLLPSKSHRLHSNRSSPSKHSRHDTSTDSESCFASPSLQSNRSREEDSFQTFLNQMVTSFVKKDRERTKHQSLLLDITQKSIEERTKIQLEWLQELSNHSDHKGRDLKRPNIQKLKQDILDRYEREQEKVKKLKETFSSHREATFIKKQYRSIKKLRQTTLHVKDRIERMTSRHSLPDDPMSSPNHSSLDITSSIQEQLLSGNKPSSLSRLQTARSLIDTTSDENLYKPEYVSPVAKSLSLHSSLPVSEHLSKPHHKVFSSESSDANTTLRDTESIFTDIADSPSRSSLNSRTDSNEQSLPCSPKQVSFTETSEHTDVEQRVATLKRELSLRKQTARQLKFELKRKQRQDLRAKELTLKQQLQEFDKEILEAQQKLRSSYPQESTTRVPDTKDAVESHSDAERTISSLTRTLSQLSTEQTHIRTAVSATDTVSEELATHLHSGDESSSSASTEMGETGHTKTPSLEQDVQLSFQLSSPPVELSLTSSVEMDRESRSQNPTRDTPQYSDTFLTSLEEAVSPNHGLQESIFLCEDEDESLPLRQDEKISEISSPASESEDKRFEIGDGVLLRENQHGTVRFYGTTSFADGVWIGVEMREAVGTCNGTMKAVSYFKCEQNHGVFVRHNKLRKLSDNTDREIDLSPADSDLESIPEEPKSQTHLSIEPPVSVVSELGPDRSITVFSETDSVVTALEDQTLRWSVESADLPISPHEVIDQLIDILLEDVIDTCISTRMEGQESHSRVNLVTSVTNSLMDKWANESVDIFLSVNSKRAPQLLHNVRPVLLELPEEEMTSPELSPVRSLPSPAEPPVIAHELEHQSLMKIADSALIFYKDRLMKQRPLDIGQLQFSRRSDTILPIAYDVANSPTRQAHLQIFRHLLFDMSYQMISEVKREVPDPHLILQPPKKFRRSFGKRQLVYKDPKPGEEVPFVARCVREMIVFPKKQSGNYQGTKEDQVETLLMKEMKEEEPEWIDYSEHEYIVKMEAADSIFNSLMEDALNTAILIRRKRKIVSF